MAGKQVIGGVLKAGNGTIIPASKAVRAGDFIYVSGQLAFGEDGNITGANTEEQTVRVMENLKAILAEAGAEMSDIIKCTCWIKDKGEFATFNRVYASYFKDAPPARSCVPSDLLLGALVEIEAIAYKPE